MYLFYHSEVRPPIVLETLKEVRVYEQLMCALKQGKGRWKELPPEYFEGLDI